MEAKGKEEDWGKPSFLRGGTSQNQTTDAPFFPSGIQSNPF